MDRLTYLRVTAGKLTGVQIFTHTRLPISSSNKTSTMARQQNNKNADRTLGITRTSLVKCGHGPWQQICARTHTHTTLPWRSGLTPASRYSKIIMSYEMSTRYVEGYIHYTSKAAGLYCKTASKISTDPCEIPPFWHSYMDSWTSGYFNKLWVIVWKPVA